MNKFVPISVPKAYESASVRATTRFVPNHREIPLARQRHTIGRYAPGAGRAAIPFESHLEYRAIRSVQALAPEAEIRSQPITLSFFYREQLRSYTPDFVVSMADIPLPLRRHGFGHVTYIEVKPLERLAYLHPLWPMIVRIFRRRTGAPLILMTDLDLATWAARAVTP